MNGKLRFYLRGLGIGMAVTALILAAVNMKNNHGEMTDAQIRERAAQLGMVDANSYSLTDAAGDGREKTEEVTEEKADTTETKAEEVKAEETEETEDTKAEDKEETKAEETEEIKAEETEETKAEETEEVKAEETKEPEKEETKTEDTKPVEPQEAEPEQPKEGSATITINNGASSETACMLLKNAGLVDSADDLNKYMIQHGYDRTIHPGTFTLSYGLSYEEICKKIAG